MNADRLVEWFERCSETPDALGRLRAFVLSLAVTGRLVAQRPEDSGFASELPAARERVSRLASTTGRLRWKPSSPITDDEIPRPLPSGWIAVRLNDLGVYVNGLAFKPTDWKTEGVPIIRIQNLTDPTSVPNYAAGPFPPEVIVRPGDILVSWSATLDAFIWAGQPGVLNQHIFRVIRDEQLSDRKFLHLLLQHAVGELAQSDHAHGLAMMHINRGPFLDHVVMLPPLAEQRRIVAKFCELIDACDRLQAARVERETARDRLGASTVARLIRPAARFADDARFAVETLPTIATRAKDIAQLRRTILSLAVLGKLVPQIRHEGSGVELLATIAARRIKAAEAASIRLKMVRPRDEANALPELPRTWGSAQLGNLVDPTATISYGVLVPGPDVDSGVPLVRAQDLLLSEHPARPRKSIGPEVEAAYGRTRLKGGEILVCVVGSIGKLGVVPPHWAGANIARAVARIAPVGDLDRDFLLTVLRSELLQTRFASATRTLAQPTLNISLLEALLIPVPPLLEQRRIVAKIRELMTLCDRLENCIATAMVGRARLLEALLNEAVASAPLAAAA